MAAFAFQNVVQNIDYIRLDSAVVEQDGGDALLLDASRLQTGSQIAVIYRYQTALSELRAIAVRSSLTTRVRNAEVTIGAAMSAWIESLEGPAQGSPADARFFDKFPEVFQYRLRRLAVLPLRAGEDLQGLLTFGRSEADAFDSTAIAAGQRAARLLTSALERDSRRHLTEEQAYLPLRNSFSSSPAGSAVRRPSAHDLFDHTLLVK